jgi:vacuolar-type H+-ATPase subunit H
MIGSCRYAQKIKYDPQKGVFRMTARRDYALLIPLCVPLIIFSMESDITDTSKKNKKNSRPSSARKHMSKDFSDVLQKLRDTIYDEAEEKYKEAEQNYKNMIQQLEIEKNSASNEVTLHKAQIHKLNKLLKWWKHFNTATVICLSGIAAYWIGQWYSIKHKLDTTLQQPQPFETDISINELVK